MMKNKKGFTLIEILAVIVVLAIIALITTPIINKYVYNSKQRSFEASIYSMFREYDYLGTNETLTVTEFNPCDFTNKQDCKFTGKIKVKVVDGKKVPFADDISNGDFCANGGSDDLIITDGYCGKNDTTAPVITSVEIINITSYSADVIVNINEPEGSITEHQYRLLDSNGNPITEWLTGDSITKNGDNYVSRKRYTDLAAGTKFYVEIRIKNNATSNNTTEKLYSNHEAYDFTTTTFARPTITYPTVWEKTKRVTLHYDKNVTSQYRLITEGNFHIGNWTDLTGEIYEMEVNNYHYIVEIKSTDGHTTYTSSAQIGYVDNEYDINNIPPKAEIKDYKNSTGVNTNEIALVLSDKLSGVKNYCISTTNEVSSCSGTGNNTTFGKWVSVSTTPEVRNITKPHVFVNGGTYYAFVEDYVGNKSSGYPVSFNRVHYDLNGGTGNVLDQVKVKDYTLVITDTIPTKSGYDFIGWDTDPTSHNPAYASKSNYTKNEDVTLYAIWRRTISVKYDGNEGIGFLEDSTCYRYNAEPNCKIVLADNAFTRNGYTFKGWALGKSGNYTYEKNTEYTFSDNITVYAGWKVNALVFNNQTINVVYNTVDQELSYTGASNGNGNYSYSEVSENNSSNAATNYFTLAANNKIKMNKLTPVSTYTYVIKATSPVTYNIDNLTSVSANATITVKLTSFDIGTGSGLVIENIPNQTYTRNAIIPAITVKLNGTTLTNNTDYTYVATNNVNVGTATITVTGKGNYKGTKTATFAIVPYNISGSGSSVAAISDLTYNGSNQYPKPAVTALGKTLTENTEVKYTYENNKDAGTGTVTMTGTGNYTGTQTKNFTIKPKSIAVVWSGTTKTFNNVNQKPSASVTTGVTNESMTLNVTGEQKNAKDGYNASVTCTSVTTNNRCANYTLTNTTTTFDIKPYNIANASMDSVAAVNYKGSAYTPMPTLKAFNVSLVNNTDYTYSYSNNINAGTATVTATGKGNYTGTKSVNFTINRIDPTKTQVDPITTTNLTYNGKDQGLVGTVNISNARIFYSVGTALTASNYSSSGSETKPSRKDAGTYTVYYYAPADNYNAQSGSFQVKIVPKSVAVSWNSSTLSLTYNGSSQKPSATVNTGITNETMSLNISGAQTNYSANAYNTSASCASVTTNNRCANYTLTNTSTTFKINQREVTYRADNQTKTYDGTALSANATCTLTGGSLVSGHTATCSSSGSQTYYGSSTKTLNSVVIKSGSTDVSANYKINRTNGTISITKRAITVKAKDQSKLNNGTALTAENTCEVVSDTKQASGDTVSCTASGSITNPGDATKTLNTVTITRSGTNVDSSYTVTKQNGTLTVIPTVMTVTFNKNGGNNPSVASKQVNYNQAYGELATVTRYGYNFDGWYTEATNGSKVVATTTVTALRDHSLYAHWTPKPYNCAAGTYLKANTEGCQTCPAGSYCGGTGSTSFGPNNVGVTTCPTSYTSAAGAKKAADCYIEVACGKYKTSATGTATASCAGGTYIGKHNSYYGSNDSCSSCGANKYCPAGSCSESSCPSGFTSSAGSDEASDCKITLGCGYYLNSNGTYGGCSSGYYNSSSGTYYYGQSTSCSQCPSGSYCTSCSVYSCPSGYTSSSGSTSINSCYTSLSCGYSLSTTGSKSQCSGGTYSSASGTYYYGQSVSCSTCGKGKYCSTGACSESSCGTGTYNGSTGQSSCTSCPSGFTSSSGSTSISDCKINLSCGNSLSSTGSVSSCGDGTQSSASGYYNYGSSVSCSSCSAGYAPNSTKCGCSACPKGTWNTKGQRCADCPSGYTTSGTGTSSESSCYITVECGKKVSSSGTVSDCTSHGYSAGGTVYYGSSLSCTAAGAGYKPTSDKCGKEACPSGTYGTDGASCTSCPSGFTSASASDEKSDCKYNLSCGYSLSSGGSVAKCAAGTYSGTSGEKSFGSSVTCSTCPAGSYCPKGSCSPTSCGSGKTSAAGSKSSSDCKSCTKCPSSGGWSYSSALGKCYKEQEASCEIGSGDYDWGSHDSSGRLKCYKKNCVESACSQSNRNESCASAHCTYYAGTTCSTSQFTYNPSTNKCVMTTDASC